MQHSANLGPLERMTLCGWSNTINFPLHGSVLSINAQYFVSLIYMGHLYSSFSHYITSG